MVFDNVTVILGPHSEPQPDACVIIEPGCGGQSRLNEDDYIEGPPELIVEVASSSESYDLHEKLRDYEEAGVREYVVVLVRSQEVRWLWLESGKYREIAADPDGVLQSRILPGLWLHAKALLELRLSEVRQTVRRGLASPEHAAFVEKLKKGRSSA
jgi:Uma2 family endonuclease